MTSHWSRWIAAVVLLTACGSDPEGPGQPAGLPPADGAALWTYLQEQNYQGAWSTWPGKGKYYEGTEPHGMLLTTYLNSIALDALNGTASSMPAGAIIVKENYMPDSTLAAVTTMYKIQGYDAAHNDWFWAKHAPDGTVEAAGKVEGCQSCHQAKADNDYIFTGTLQ